MASKDRLVLWGDAWGVLQAMAKGRAFDEMINNVCAEMQLMLAPLGLELQVKHLWSEENAHGDALSRVAEGAVLPTGVSKVKPSIVKDPRWTFLLPII